VDTRPESGSNSEDEDEFEDAKTDLDYEDFTVSAPPQHRSETKQCFLSKYKIRIGTGNLIAFAASESVSLIQYLDPTLHLNKIIDI
jgi:hypothetical protein